MAEQPDLTNIPPVPAKIAPFYEFLKHRHSVYTLDDSSPLSDAELKNLVTATLQTTPSYFNSQTTRVLVLLRSDHRKLWDALINELRDGFIKQSGQEAWDKMEKKMTNVFRAGFGTIVFFEDEAATKQYQDNMPMYGHLFPDWGSQSNGMNQLVLWTALEAEGYGANLQHYNFNEGLENTIKGTFNVPKEWKVKSQLVFGGVTGQWPGMKDKKSPDETVMWFGGEQ